MITCIHFRSSVVKCAADVDVAALRDADDRVPCVLSKRGVTGTKTCDKRQFPGGVAATPGPMVAMLDAFLDDRCPKCKEIIHGEMEFNGATLAMPCRHVLRSAKED